MGMRDELGFVVYWTQSSHLIYHSIPSWRLWYSRSLGLAEHWKGDFERLGEYGERALGRSHLAW
jgi:hypothetical protein